MTRSSFLFPVAFVAAIVGDAARGENLLFKRGDANLDGAFNISDATLTLRYLFLETPNSTLPSGITIATTSRSCWPDSGRSGRCHWPASSSAASSRRPWIQGSD